MKKFDKTWWQILIIGLIFIIVWKFFDPVWLGGIISKLVDILMPFIIGAILAFFTINPSKRLEMLLEKKFKKLKHSMARVISVLSVYVVLIAAITLILKFLIPAVYENINDLVKNAPAYYQTAADYINNAEWLKSMGIIEKLTQTVLSYLNFDMMGKFVNVVSEVASSVLTFVVGIIISIYILLERSSLKRLVKNLLSHITKNKKLPVIAIYGRKLVGIFNSYFLSLLLDAVIVGAVSTLFFAIFGAPYPWLLGLLVALGNMIPFFGPIVTAIVSFVICAIAKGFLPAIWVLVFLIVLGQLDANLVQPKIVGTSVGISPFWVILAVTLFGGLFGAWGMILGVPIMGAIKVFYGDFHKDGILGNDIY